MVKAINLRHSQDALFKVEFLPWPAIEELLYDLPEVREFIYGPIESAALTKLEAQHRSVHAAIEALSVGPTPTEVDAELDNCKALLEAHRHEEAKTFLLRLEQRSWDKLSARQKFRLKANLGATKLAAGKFEEAGRLYLESKTYQPDDPKAQVNEALGHLLTGNSQRAFELSSQIRAALPPHASCRRSALQALYQRMEEEIGKLTAQVAEQAEQRSGARLLITHPGVGPVTALATDVFLGDPQRFADGKALASYVGLIPREYSSGERQRFGAVTKQGSPLLRFLWGEAGAHAARRDPDLQRFYRRKLVQKGLGKARVAVARKLGIRLWIMLRDQIDYEEFCRRGQKQSGAACAGMSETGFGANRHRPVD